MCSVFFVQFGLGFAIFAIDVSQNTVKQKLTNTIYSATRYPSPTPIIRDRHQRSVIPGIGIEVLTPDPVLVLVLGIGLGLLVVLVLGIDLGHLAVLVLVLGIDHGLLAVLILVFKLCQKFQ